MYFLNEGNNVKYTRPLPGLSSMSSCSKVAAGRPPPNSSMSQSAYAYCPQKYKNTLLNLIYLYEEWNFGSPIINTCRIWIYYFLRKYNDHELSIFFCLFLHSPESSVFSLAESVPTQTWFSSIFCIKLQWFRAWKFPTSRWLLFNSFKKSRFMSLKLGAGKEDFLKWYRADKQWLFFSQLWSKYLNTRNIFLVL